MSHTNLLCGLACQEFPWLSGRASDWCGRLWVRTLMDKSHYSVLRLRQMPIKTIFFIRYILPFKIQEFRIKINIKPAPFRIDWELKVDKIWNWHQFQFILMHKICFWKYLFPICYRFSRSFSRSDFPLSLNLRQHMFLQAKVKSDDKQLSLMVETAFATPSPDENDPKRHDILKDG